MGGNRKKKNNNNNRKMRRKLLWRRLPPVTPRKEGLVFGEGDCLCLVQTQSMGWGVVATRDIEEGTLLLREAPLASTLVIDPTQARSLQPFFNVASYFPGNTTLYTALVAPMIMRGVTEAWLDNFASRPRETWDDTMKKSAEESIKVLRQYRPKLLAKFRLGDLKKLIDRVLGVLKANCFLNTTPLTGIFYASSLYDMCTLFNHSCCANAMDFTTGAADNLDMLVVAKTKIPKGSQVFISYGQSKVKQVYYRRAALTETFAFDCQCGRCETEAAQLPGNSADLTIRCSPPLFELYQKATQLSTQGQALGAYDVYFEILTQHKNELDAAEPSIRSLVIGTFALLHLQWGGYHKVRRLSLNHLAYLRTELCKAADYFEGCGLASAQMCIALSQVFKVIERRIRMADKISSSDTGTNVGPEVLAFLNAMEDVVAACEVLYGSTRNYDFTADTALSTLFSPIIQSVAICMKSYADEDDDDDDEKATPAPGRRIGKRKIIHKSSE